MNDPITRALAEELGFIESGSMGDMVLPLDCEVRIGLAVIFGSEHYAVEFWNGGEFWMLPTCNTAARLRHLVEALKPEPN